MFKSIEYAKYSEFGRRGFYLFKLIDSDFTAEIFITEDLQNKATRLNIPVEITLYFANDIRWEYIKRNLSVTPNLVLYFKFIMSKFNLTLNNIIESNFKLDKTLSEQLLNQCTNDVGRYLVPA